MTKLTITKPPQIVTQPDGSKTHYLGQVDLKIWPPTEEKPKG